MAWSEMVIARENENQQKFWSQGIYRSVTRRAVDCDGRDFQRDKMDDGINEGRKA